MQETVGWPSETDIPEPVAQVLIDGQEVEVQSISVASELGSAMPDRVAAGGGGVVATTGEVSFLPSDDLLSTAGNPWADASHYVDAKSVVVDAGYRDYLSGQTHSVRQITGHVESLDGSALSHGIDLEVVDYAPLLDRNITIEPLLQEYPSLEDWGPRRGAGLSPMYITDRILRHCGFYATPRMISQALVSAPMMGSVAPERGVLYAATAQSDTAASAAFRPTAWGMGLGNGVIAYRPNYGSRGHGRRTSTLHVSFLRQRSRSSTPSESRIDLRWGSFDNAICVYLRSDDTIMVQYRNRGVPTDVAILNAADVNASEAFTVIVESSGVATIYASNGASSNGYSPMTDVMGNQDLDEISVRVPQDSHTVGGLQVAFSEVRNQGFQRSAFLDPPAYYHSLRAFPFQHDVNCLDLLKDQAQAELAAMWIDEYGNFRWRNRHQLRDASPVGTLTAQHDLLDLGWQVPVRSVFSRVELEHDAATVTRRGVPSITVSDSRGSTLSNGDTEDKFYEPPADQDWHEVAAPQWLGGTINYWELRRGRGSYRGGMIVDEDNNERLAYSSRLHQTWSPINKQRWLLHSEAHSLSSDESIEQSLRDRPDLYGRFAEENLPIIRAKGLVQWDQNTTTGTARGPVLAPVFRHNVGPWIQSSTELQNLADWLADYLTKPDIILRDVPIYPDPRIQLGDVFWLEDDTEYQVRLKIVVMGKTLSYQNSGDQFDMSQRINCRVIDLVHLDIEQESR